MSATINGDYTKATVDGEHIRSYVIPHLDPNTIYEIRMQTFDSKHASDLSQKMHQKTTGNFIRARNRLFHPTYYRTYKIVGVIVGDAL